MKLFYSIFILLLTQVIYSQSAIIKGTTIEESTGKSLPGATVEVKGTPLNATSDADGNFIIRNVPIGEYELQFTANGFKTKLISEVKVTNNEETSLTVSLEESKNELKEVVITSTKMKTESVKSLLTMQKNSVSVSDGISAETIKRTPDKNTSDVLKRISGASIQDNKFVIIRGLNDRYNAAFLNGAPLPSSEPDRKAFSFDVFPSNMLDNLIITKTASPDLPGDFAGGVVQINTKSVPDKDFQSLTIGSGYNTITTFKKQRTYAGSSTDWLGFDNGVRDLPSTIPPNTETFNALSDPEKALVAKSFQSDWNITDKRFKPNLNFQYTIGKRIDFNNKVFGFLFSLSNNQTQTFDETIRNDYSTPSVLETRYVDKNYTEQVLTSSLANFSLKFNENHSITFKNIYSINSTDLVVERSGQREIMDTRVTNSDVRWFTSNKIYSGQLNGDHYFSKPKIRLNWTGFFSKIDRSIPNLRRNIYTIVDPNSSDPNETIPYASIASNNGGPDYGGGMFFSGNNETISGGKLDIAKKFNIGKNLINEIKVGVFKQVRDREFFARQLQYNQAVNNFEPSLLNLPNATIFSVANMGMLASGKNGFTLFDFTKPTDSYKAGSNLNAAYMMLDNKYKKIRLVWGVRIEDYTQTLDSKKTETELLNLNNHQTDLLPSANLIYSVNKKQNLRLSYSKTLNRPEFRELAPFGFYDFRTQFFTQGNDTLKIAKVQNIDLRYEIYPGKGQIVSISYFNKKFTNPIETQQTANNKTVIYQNAKGAKNSGIELEFRTLLSSLFMTESTPVLDDVTLFSNLAIIKSNVDTSNFASGNTEKSRPLQGQSPYVFNAGLQYLNKDNGWAISTNINRAGNRIAIVGNTETERTIWEKGRTFLDAQVAKSFYKNKLELKFNIQNILAQDLIFYQNNYENTANYGTLESFANQVFTGDKHYQNGYNKNDDDLFWKTKFGRTFSLSVTYNF